MASYDEYRNTAQPAFQPGRNASTAPLTSPAVPRAQLWSALNPQGMPGANAQPPNQMPGGGGPSPNPAQSPQAGSGQPMPGGTSFVPGNLPAPPGQTPSSLSQWEKGLGQPQQLQAMNLPQGFNPSAPSNTFGLGTNTAGNAAFGQMPPNLAALLQKAQGGSQAGFNSDGGSPTLPSNMPSLGAFGATGVRPLMMGAGLSGFGSPIGNFRSGPGLGGGARGVGGAFGR